MIPPWVVLLFAWGFRSYIPAGEIRSIHTWGTDVLFATPGGFWVMDSAGAFGEGIPTPRIPILAVLNDMGNEIFWVDEEGSLYRTDRNGIHTTRLAFVGQGHSLAFKQNRIYFANLNNHVIVLDPAGFVREGSPPQGLVWAGLRGEVPQDHPGRFFLDSSTRLVHYNPEQNVAWVVEDTGVVRVDLQTAQRKIFGFIVPPIYPLQGAFPNEPLGVFGEGGVAIEEGNHWRWIQINYRIVDGCKNRKTLLTPFALIRLRGRMPQFFPLRGGPFKRMVCEASRFWVGGEGGVYEMGQRLLLSLKVNDMAWADSLLVASDMGLFVLQDTVWHQIQDTAGILQDKVLDLAIEHGELWAATYRGVVRVSPSTKVELPGMKRIAINASGLVGWNGSFYVLAEDGFHVIPTPVDQPMDVVDIQTYRDGFAVVTPKGIWILRP